MTQDLRLCGEQGPFQGGSVSALPLGEMLFSEFWSQVYICYFQRANRRAKNINGFNHFAVCLSFATFMDILTVSINLCTGKTETLGFVPHFVFVFQLENTNGENT